VGKVDLIETLKRETSAEVVLSNILSHKADAENHDVDIQRLRMH
jgi:hypothetical protein